MPTFSMPRQETLEPMSLPWGFQQVGSYERFRAAYPSALDIDDEKRHCARRSLRCPMTMTQITLEPVAGDAHAIEGECIDISDSGMYAIVPLGYGVANGQRYLFRMRVRERGPGPEPTQTVTQEGVIVRTELLLDEGGDRVGVGIRLCGHRSGDLTIPRA